MATTQHHADNSELRECFAFTLILSGFDKLTNEIENGLFEAGCDDGLLGIHAGTPYLSFDREADSLEDAIKTAIHDVQTCGLPIQIVKVNPSGAETIETINAYLRTRCQLHEKLESSIPPELLHKIDEILDALMNNDPSAVAQLLS